VRAGALVCTDRPNGAYRPLCGASLTVSNQRPDRALDRTGFALTASGLKQCLADSGGKETMETLKLEKVFLSLA